MAIPRLAALARNDSLSIALYLYASDAAADVGNAHPSAVA
jgi:hypothetical protein